MKKGLIDRLKEIAEVITFVAGVGIFGAFASGCEPPYEPIPTEKPTEKPDKPTAEPTAEPTPEPELNYMDISGNVQDGETLEGAPAIIQIYNNEDNNFLGEFPTNNYGNFSITLDELVDELPEGVRLETRLSNSDWENGTSFIRKTRLPQGDHAGISILPTPFYSDFDNDGYADLDRDKNGEISQQEKEDFIEHIGRENVWSAEERVARGLPLEYVNGNSKHGVKKWNEGELSDTIEHPKFKGFKIDTISFSVSEQNEIENNIKTTNYPGASEIQIIKEANPTTLGDGWVPIYHSAPGYGPYTILWDMKGKDGYLENAKVYLNTTTAPSVVRHEAIYHVKMACAGHPNGLGVPSLFNSIGEYTASEENPTAINIKEDKILKNCKGMEPLEDILGL